MRQIGNVKIWVTNILEWVNHIPFTKFIQVVLIPFIITRLLWLLIGWFSSNFLPDPSFSKYTEQGWFLSPHFLIDMWSRWDARWYISIIEGGYSAPSDLTKYLSNIAFYPLFPYMVKGLAWFLPDAWVSRSDYLLIGLIISNLAFLSASWLLYRLVIAVKNDEILARHTLEFLFVFPTSFYFSCFYTESLFFFLTVAAILAGLKNKWFLSCLLGAFSALTRPQGVFILIPLLWIYLTACQWDPRKIRLKLAWVLIIPASVALHFLSLYKLSGSLYAPLLAQKAWERGGNLWENLRQLFSTASLDVYKIDAILWLMFFVILIWGFRRMSAGGLNIYALLMLILPIATGTLFSASRFLIVIFPVFILLADMLQHKEYRRKLVMGVFFTLQVLYFLGWVNYYWIA